MDGCGCRHLALPEGKEGKLPQSETVKVSDYVRTVVLQKRINGRLGGVVGSPLAFCIQGWFDPGPSRWVFMKRKIDSGNVVSL
ncbi:hypothetical protein TNCV_392031 [Trichonephila clavipes]|nr:hypothetical protein TNCV_392031 [Trichonephila clavipes]